MEIEDIKVIQERLCSWDFLEKLPRELQGFKYQAGGLLQGHVLTLCSYVNEELHRQLDFIYTKETFDYMPVKKVGLHTFRDVRYITRSKDAFAEKMQEVLPRLLRELDPEAEPGCISVLRKKGVLDWHYASKLPETIGKFKLFIHPNHPLEYINNSVIFLDYTDFEGGNQLVFLYNQVVNNFFAETKQKFIPGTIHDFDCQSLAQLEKLLDKNLESYLAGLS